MASPVSLSIPGEAHEICDRLHDAGERAWVVGGSVRDLLRGVAAHDFDLATTAKPTRVVELFKRTVPTGIAHGTVTVLLGKKAFEVTTLRGDVGYADGRRPDRVEYVDDIVDDLARRDFTVNAIAYDPREGAFIDPFDGKADIEAGVLRAVGEPLARFREDGLRILRGARFVATLDFSLEPATEAAFRPSLDVYAKVSRERIRDEWNKAFSAERPSRAFEVMARTGILEVTSPTLGAFSAERPEEFSRALRAMDACPREPMPRLAALLALALPGETPALAAAASARFASEFIHELRGSREERARIPRFIEGAASLPEAGDAVAVRRFIARLGREDLGPTLELARVFAESDEARMGVEAVHEATRRALEAGAAVGVKDLALTGGELISALGTGPGKHIGALLAMLFEEVTLDPSKNTREALTALAKELEGRAREAASA